MLCEPLDEEDTPLARVILSPELSAFIAERIAHYAAEATERYHNLKAPQVAEFGALPLIRHWFETIGLRPDGEIVKWNTDGPETYEGTCPVEDRYDWLSALVAGARRYPELQELLPQRWPGAVDCRCVGIPLFAPGKVLCPECCGLGWVQAKKVDRNSGAGG
jgi:hypothetical protein